MLIDAVFALILFIACYKGYQKGLVVALFSVIAIIVGLAAALKLSAVVAATLSENTNTPGKWLPVVSFIIVFIVVAFLVRMGARLLQKSLELVMLGLINRLCGMILYIFLYSILYSIFLFYANELHFIKPGTRDASVIYPYIQPLGPWVINGMGAVIPLFRDIFVQLQHFFGDVSNKIQH